MNDELTSLALQAGAASLNCEQADLDVFLPKFAALVRAISEPAVPAASASTEAGEAIGFTREQWVHHATRVYLACGDTEAEASTYTEAIADEQDWHGELDEPFEMALADIEGRPARRAASTSAQAQPTAATSAPCASGEAKAFAKRAMQLADAFATTSVEDSRLESRASKSVANKLRAALKAHIEAALAATQAPAVPAAQEPKRDPERDKIEKGAGYWQAFTHAMATRGATLEIIERRGRRSWDCTVGATTARARTSPEAALHSALMQEFDGNVPESFGLPKSTVTPLVPSATPAVPATNARAEPTSGRKWRVMESSTSDFPLLENDAGEMFQLVGATARRASEIAAMLNRRASRATTAPAEALSLLREARPYLDDPRLFESETKGRQRGETSQNHMDRISSGMEANEVLRDLRARIDAASTRGTS